MALSRRCVTLRSEVNAMDPLRKPDRVTGQAQWFSLAEASSIGIAMAVAIAIGAFGGQWLQEHVTHWRPWTFYIGFFIGLGAAANIVVRTALKFQAYLDQEAEDEVARGPETAPAEDPGRGDEPGDRV